MKRTTRAARLAVNKRSINNATEGEAGPSGGTPLQAWCGLETLEPRILLSAVIESNPLDFLIEDDSAVIVEQPSETTDTAAPSGDAGDDDIPVFYLSEDESPAQNTMLSEPGDDEAATLDTFTTLTVDEPLRPVLLLPGIGGTLWADGFEDEWYTTRGIDPEKLAVDPLAGIYDDIVASLINVGYVEGETLFVANYDWRMSPGPRPDSGDDIDGIITGLTAESISNDTFGYGVDYLGYWLNEASQAWMDAGHGELADVDIVAHSTGGLVARSYLQADFYEDDETLPKVHNLVMTAVPNRGASKSWNPLNNDWSVDQAMQVVLSKIGWEAYQRMEAGAVIEGDDGDTITLSDFDGMTEDEAYLDFIRRYVPTINDLLATYEFLSASDDLSLVESINDPSHTHSHLRNSLQLDLNDGLDLHYGVDDLDAAGTWTDPLTGQVHNPNRFLDGLGGTASVIYNHHVPTLTTVTTETGPIDGELNFIVPMHQFIGGGPEPGQQWYKPHGKKTDEPGDGTVPLQSLVGQFEGQAATDPRVQIVSLDVDDEHVDHTGIMFAVEGQMAMIDALLGDTDISYTEADLSTDLAPSLHEMLLNVIARDLLNPAEVLDSTEIADDMTAGLHTLAQYGSDFMFAAISDSAWGEAMPGFETNMREALGLDEIINSFIFGTVRDVLGNVSSPGWLAPTTDAVADAWLALDGITTASGITLAINSDRTYAGLLSASHAELARVMGWETNIGADQLLMNLSLTASYSGDLPLELAMEDDLLAFTGGADVSYSGSVTFDITFGYDTDETVDENQRAFLRVNEMSAELSADAENINPALRVGFVEGAVQDGYINLNARLDTRFAHADDDDQLRMTRSVLSHGLLVENFLRDNLIIDRVGTVEASFPVSVSVGTYTTAAGPRYDISSDDFFDSLAVEQGFVDFEEIWAFTTLDAGSVIDLLRRTAVAMAEASDSPVLDVAIPFAQGLTLGDVLDFEQAIEDSVVEPFIDDDGYFTFHTFEQFVEQLAEAAGVDASTISPHYDPVTQELSYHVPFSFAFAPEEAQFNLGVDVGPLFDVRSGGFVDFEAMVEGGFTVGMELTPMAAAITAAREAPADGRLTSTARFKLAIGDLEPVDVAVTRDSSNESLDDLIEDINAALVVAGVADRVAARRSESDADRVEFHTLGRWTGAASIRLTNPNSTAQNQLGFDPLHFDADGLRERAYLEDVALSGSVSVTADDVNAFGRFGFLEIDVDGANGSLTATADYQLVNPDDGSSRLGVLDLAGYLRDDAASTIAGDGFGGYAYAELPIAVNPNPFGGNHPDDPTITLHWGNLADLNTLELEYNAAMEDLLGYGELDFATIVGGLGELADFLSDQMADMPLLSTELPLLQQSVADLFDLAGSFAEKVSDIAEDPSVTLDQLADRLAEALGINPQDVDLSLESDMLRFDLSLFETFATDIPLRLDLVEMFDDALPDSLSGLADFITAGTDGRLTVDAEAIFDVAFGFDLSDPANPTPIVFEETGFNVGLHVAGTDLAGELGIDGLAVVYIEDGYAFLGDENDPKNMARFTGGLNTTASGHYALTDLATSDFFVDLTGSAATTLPLYFPTKDQPLRGEDDPEDGHHFALTVGDLSDPLNTAAVTSTPDLAGLIDGLDLRDQLGYLLVGLDYLLEQIQDTLERDVFSQRLPIIGDQLSNAGDAIATLREGILTDLRAALANAPSKATDIVRQKLFEVLHENLAVLGDVNNDGEITLDDVMVNIDETDEVQFALQLTPASFDLGSDLEFDLALPALELDIDVNPQVSLDLNVDLVFGVSRADGFYFDTAGDQVTAALAVTIPDSTLDGSLGFLDLEVHDRGSAITAGFFVDVIAPGNRIRWDEFVNAGDTLTVDAGFSGGANLDLDLDVSFDGVAALPSMAATFVANWDFDSDGISAPTIAFNDVTLSAGDFIDNFVAPVLDQIQDIIGPVQPIIDFLTAELPVISDLLGSMTVLDLIAYLPDDWAYVDGEMLEALGGLLDVIDSLASIPVIDGNVQLNLGSFNLDGAEDLTTEGGLLDFAPNITQAIAESPLAQFAALSLEAGEFVTDSADLGDTGSGLEFPLLEDPSLAFRLLLGQAVDLFTFDMPHIEFLLEFSQDFLVYTPPDIKIELAGEIGGRIDLSFGFDTSGLSRFRDTGEVSDILTGFYISDVDENGADVAEATLWGALLPAIKAGFGPVSVGVYGGLRASLFADLRDPNDDGKVHVNEFVRSVNEHGAAGLWCTFDLTGEVAGVLGVFFEVAGSRVSEELVNEVLWDFSIFDGPCFPGRFEANETRDVAADLGAAPGVHIVNGRILDQYDLDWYSFDLLRGDSIEILLEHSQSQGNIDFEVYDAQTQDLVARAKSSDDDERMVLRDLEAGQYLVYVFGSGDAVDYTINIDPFVDADDPASSSTNVYYVADSGSFYPQWVNYYATAVGDDVNNDGRSHDSPLATIGELLSRYTFTADDLILIDGGRYDENIVLTAAHSGAAIAGAPKAHRTFSDFHAESLPPSTPFDFLFGVGEGEPDFVNPGGVIASTTINPSNGPAITIDGASGMMIHGMEISEIVFAGDSADNIVDQTRLMGDVGVHFLGGEGNAPQDNLIQSSLFTSNLGVQVDSAAAQTITGNTFEHQGVHVTAGAAADISDNLFESVEKLFAIRIESGAVVTLTNNDITGYETGIINHSFDVTFVDNRIFENEVGMTGTGLLGSVTAGAASEIFQNDIGILLSAATADAIVQHNRVFENETGIRSEGSGENLIHANLVYENVIGIDGGAVVGGGDWLSPNIVHDNSEVGIFAAANAEVRFNELFNNPFGIVAADGTHVHHNVIYRADDPEADEPGYEAPDPDDLVAVLLQGAQNVFLENNTIYTALGHGVALANGSRDARLRNNIIWVRDGYGIKVSNDSQQGFDSNYNNLYTTDEGVLVHWQKAFHDLYDWQAELGQDLDSIGYTSVHPDRDNPLFVDLDGSDFRLTDNVSTSIDAGDPATDFSVETDYLMEDGGRVNLGAYGNTASAAESAESWIRLAWPVYHVDWVADRGAEIRWETYNVSGDVRVTVEDSNGTTVATIGEFDAELGAVLWSPDNAGLGESADPSERFQIRIAAVEGDAEHVMRESFAVLPAGTTEYFVNDGDTADDQYTSAAGDNRNTGTTAADPKASLLATLRMYNLGAADTVHVDTGDYLLPATVLISGVTGIGDDEGVTIVGPTDADKQAVLDRGLTLTGSAVVELIGADLTTLSHLTLIGGERGLYVHSESTFFDGSHLEVADSATDGITITASATNVTLGHLTVHGHGGRGVVVETPLPSLSDSYIHNNAGTGLYLRGTGDTLIQRNVLHDNHYAIDINNGVSGTLAVIGSTELDAADGNVIYDNRGRAVHAINNVLVAGNNIYGHEGLTAVYLQGGADASHNVIADSRIGIHSYGSSAERVEHNRISGSSYAGIYAEHSSQVIGNVLHENEMGIRAQGGHNRAFRGLIANNIITDSMDAGLYIHNSSGTPEIVNNTFFEPEADAIVINNSTPHVKLRNNIVHVESGRALSVGAASHVGFESDFNLFHVTGTASFGTWQNAPIADLATWRSATFNDRRSIAQDPMFVDPANRDLHLRSADGSFHGGSLAPMLDANTLLPVLNAGTLTIDAASSPGIDRGHDDDPYANEPTPNGGFINVGAYGNTSQASLSPEQYVMIITPDGAETWPMDQAFTVQWRSHDFTGTVDIELWRDGQAEAVATLASDVQNTGTFEWQLPDTLTAADDYRIRITRDGSLVDTSANTFTITDPVTAYYVNDASTDGDVYTAAPGDNILNDGLSAQNPLASIRAVLDAYDLGEGDIIYVDAGTYELTTNIMIDASSAGVRIVGSHDAAAPTILDRNDTSSGSYVFELENLTLGDDPTLTLENLHITGAQHGIYAGDGAGAHGVVVTGSNFYGNSNTAVYAHNNNDHWQFTGNTVTGHSTAFEIRGDHHTYLGNIFNHASSRSLYILGDEAHIEGNDFHDNRTGLYTNSDGNVIVDNVFFDNWTGADVAGSLVRVAGNTFYGHESLGLTIRGNGAIAGPYESWGGNTFYDNSGAMNVETSARAIGNHVYNNGRGIWVSGIGASAAIDNLIHDNAGYGIDVRHSGIVTGNVIYNNGSGIDASGLGHNRQFRGTIANNVIYDNASFGIRINHTTGTPEVVNNTVIQAGGGVGIDVTSNASRVDLRNNIVHADDATAMRVHQDSQLAVTSDYNLFMVTGTGTLYQWGEESYSSRAEVVYATGLETSSIVADPAFVDAANDDYRLLPSSPGIDAGNPADAFTHEPTPNGGRVNIGAFGNTEQATPSTDDLLHILGPHALQKHELGGRIDLVWRTYLHDYASRYADTIQQHAPVVYYRLNEESGDVVADSSGNGRDGERYRGDWGYEGILGALHGSSLGLTDNGNNYITVADPENDLSLTQNVSMGMWVNVESTNRTWSPLIHKGAANADDADVTFALWMNSSDRTLRLITADGEGAQILETDADLIGNDNWHHVGAVIDRDAGEMHILLDGEIVATGTVRQQSAVSSDTPLYIMRSAQNPYSHAAFDGRIDEVAVYDSALQQAHFREQAVEFRGTVDVELLKWNGTDYDLATTIASDLPDHLQHAWDVPTAGLDLDADYVIRVTSSFDTELWDQTAPFRFAPAGDVYYINDGSLDHDVHTTAVGNDANHGKSADAPMASIAALLETYELDESDVIYIDTGLYEMQRNAVLSDVHSGVTIIGASDAENPDAVTTFDRGDRSSGYYAFELDGATDVTFDNLHVTNAHIGIYADVDAGSHDVTITNSSFYYNYDAGVRLLRGNDGLTVEDSLFYGENPGTHNDPNRQTTGLHYEGHSGTIRNSTAHSHYDHGFDVGITYGASGNYLVENNVAYNNRQYGIHARGATDSTFRANELHSNNYGIYVSGSGSFVTETHAYDNNVGIYSLDSTLIAGNHEIYNNGTGIRVGTGARAESNTVFDNTVGIAISGSSTSRAYAIDNVAYGNGTGIDAIRLAIVTQNLAYDNERGIYAHNGFTGEIANNLVHDNANYALRVVNTNDRYLPTVINNTFVHGNAGTAVRIEAGAADLTFRNNIVQAGDADLVLVSSDSQLGFASDYNLFNVTGSGTLFQWGDIAVHDLSDWFYEIGYDANSIVADPQFVDMASGDYRLQVGSPGIDAGHPDDPYQQEPAINGGRVNIGAFGNTEHATAGEDEQLQILSPHVFDKHQVGRTMAFDWRTWLTDFDADYADLALQHDPALYLRFNDEAGSDVLDSSGNDLHGVRTGGSGNTGEWGAPGILGHGYGTALRIDAGNGSHHVRVDDPTGTLDLTDNVTMSMWVNVESTNRTWTPLFHKGNSSSESDVTFALWMHNADRSLRLITADGEGAQILDTDLDVVLDDAWHHLGAVIDRDAGEMRIYVDGEAVATAAVRQQSAVSSDQPLYIMNSTQSLYSHAVIDGRVDELTVHGAALDDAHFQARATDFRGTVDIELLSWDGSDYQLATTIADDLTDTGSFAWDIPTDGLDLSLDYVVRITSSLGDQPYGQTDAFRFAGDGNIYYINDGSLDHDVHTTAVGDNTNTGKAADDPMASLNALLAVYDLNPGDIIYVDAGSYTPLQNIVLNEAHSGITIIGASDAENPDAVTTFDRGDRSSGYYAFELDGATDVTFDNLHVTNAHIGIYADVDAGSHDVTITNSSFYYNYDAGVRLLRGNDGLTVEDSLFYGENPGTHNDPNRQTIGLHYEGHSGTIRNNIAHSHYDHGFETGITYGSSSNYLVENNVAYNNRQYGINARGATDSTYRANELYGNNYGIYVSGSGSFVTETHAYDNNVGIYSLDSTLIAGNHEIYNNGLGIEATNGGRIENNTVFENNAGIVGSSSVVVTGNWAFNNTTFGIAGNRTVQIIGNRVFDNRDGIVGTDKVGSAGNRHFRGLIQNNLVYDNEDVGIAVDGSASGNSIRIINNTVYQGVGNAVHLTRSGADTTLINNILWTDLGSIVFLDDDATGALISDHNLFYRGEANLASIISDQGSVHDSLTDWQTAQPEQDVHSFEGDPLFVNINGANDVLGDSLEGALDDNFRLSADSPAIDAAHTWWASPTDIDRHHRADDPGTTNIGSDDYYADTLGNSMFDDTIGVAQNWRSTNSSWLHTFTDFSFDFFGETYDQLRIGTNGLLNLASNFSQASDPDHSEVKLAERTMIAPLWADLSTHTSTDAGNDIFIEETSDHLTIRWHATHIESGELAEFSATLFADGTIRFDYGQLPEEIAATIGISRGNNQHYVLSPHQNAIPAAPTDSVQFSLRPGHVDIGAYEFRGSSLDDTPPAVVTVDPQAVEDQSATNQSFSQIVVHFTEPLDSINANAPEGFRLLKGTDGNFNESIDLLPTYSAGDTFVTLNVPSGLLTDGTYQLTLFGDNAITDLSGVALDGDGDGQAGGDFIRTFTIDTVAPQVGFEALVTPDASPQLTGTVDDAEAQVTVTIDGNQYDAQNLGDGSWSLAADIIAPLEAGEYDVHVAAIDQAGNLGETTVTSGLTIEAVLAAEVVGRHIFYNGSYFDGHDGGASAADDNAIAPDKQALLEGETATFANYTSYTRGINGIMLDIADLPDPAALSLADFNFQIGNDDDVANWSAAPLPVSFSLRPGEGEAGADRVTLIWEDAAITNTWLQVTVMAGETTGLAADNVFYFGNAVGETGDSESDAQVTSADEDGVAQNPHSPFNPATIDSPYDFNRDRLVSAQDRLIARSNQTDAASALQLITPTSAEVVTESQTFEVQDSEDGDESFDVFDQQAADQWLAMNSYSASSTTFSDESSHTPPTWSRPLWMDLQEDGQKRRSSSLTELSSETSDMVDTLSLVKPVALIR